jgi:MoaA/NifB/PqqE/SkfB family radical SAM enzyme
VNDGSRTAEEAATRADARRTEDLGAPLYVAWQITNECNLACLHCIEESGPGKAFPDELSEREILEILDQMRALEVPYLSFSGGEPMVHPHFFGMVEHFCAGGGQLKIETNGHYLSPENCEKFHRLGVKAVQVSIDGASRETFNRMRVRGEFQTAVDGVRNLRAAGVPIEIDFSPTRFNIGEIGAAVDLAHELDTR